jgi:hypothetical protein
MRSRVLVVVVLALAVVVWIWVEVVPVLSSIPLDKKTLLVSDPDAAPYLLSPSVQRESVGLEPIPATGQVRIVRRFGEVRVEFERRRFTKTVFLDPVKGGYRWVAEEDTHYGPLTYEESFDSQRERVYIEFSERDGLYASYSGPRQGLSSNYRGLDLVDVAPLLDEWRGQQRQSD